MTEARRAPRIGYTRSAWEAQSQLENRFRDAVSADAISAFHARLTARPHIAGTEAGHAVADYLRDTLVREGLDVEVSEYSVYLSMPRSIAVELVTPVSLALCVTEPASALDPDTSHPDLGPGFVAYSASGDVTAPVVYANYGLPDDYAILRELGVDVRGTIVLARYGKSHRAVKLHTAEQAGAAGIVLYNDPADDGFARGATWPDGYWRTEHQLQRGNGKYSWFWHGDPLTPGVAATRDAPRWSPETAPTLPRIPAAVLAWGEARKILERMQGPVAPSGFQGALPFTYHVGDDTVRVGLHVQMDAGLRTIRDVIARIPGSVTPDRGIMLGGHHDAWTFGGLDPCTATAALLEVARGLAALRRSGWQPRRSITIAFWDAEEFGLLGSTEYAEEHAHALRDEVVCYVNCDLYMNGRLDAGGVPSLRDFVVEVARDVPDGTGSLYDAWRADALARRPTTDATLFEVELRSLGSGADFVPFQSHLGLPVLSLEFNATGGYTYGPYHSIYDTRFFVETVVDPGFRRGVDLVRLLGTVALRMTEVPVMPFRFTHYAEQLSAGVALAAEWPSRGEDRVALADLLRPIGDDLTWAAETARRLERAIDDALAAGSLDPSVMAVLNDLLARMEQRFLDESEAPERRWYRHLVHGWNIYSLYAGQPFPALANAVRAGDPQLVRQEVQRLSRAFERFREGLESSAALASRLATDSRLAPGHRDA